ncbi:MAG: S41 family peptidase [Cytophagales bacterium]|nr:S41 family peptidase [Cytophagales bacterium]
MKNLLFALSLLHCFVVEAQDKPTFSIEQLKEDFEVFQGSLEDSHPGLYWYRNKAEMDQVFQSGKDGLTQPMTERQFYRILSSALSKVGCGHTYISLSKQTTESEMVAFLPFQVQFEDGKAFFIKSYGDPIAGISPGNRLTRMNGAFMDSIYAGCIDMLSGDGFTETGKLNMLNAHFWYTYTELFGAPNTYEIQFLNDDLKEETISVPAMPKEEMYAHYFENDQPEEAKRNVILTFDNGIATLMIKAFFGWKEGLTKTRIEKKFKETFRQIEENGADQLIIDLRGNGGGRVPWVLYSYFVNESFLFANNADLIFSKSSDYYSHQKLPNMKWIKRKWWHTWFPGSSKMSHVDSTRYAMTGLYMTKPYKPKGSQFEGEVFILIDGFSFSAASDFAAMMKSSGLATIIGEESGGGYYGNTSMGKSFVTLPHSKLELAIPLVRHQLNVDPDRNPFGRGVIPDHEVLPSVEDVLNGKDRQMEWTLNFIQNGSN